MVHPTGWCAVSAVNGFLSQKGKVEGDTFRTAAYLAVKAQGDKSMPAKRESPKMCRVVSLASPVRMVKLFVKPEFSAAIGEPTAAHLTR